MHRLRFRQVHLDFHTSPEIREVGAGFDRREWQARLRQGHVDSVTCFSVCHHGWSYTATRVGKRHPHLSFDLLRAQYEACKEINVNVPIYLTAGINNRVAYEHPEWREVGHDGSYPGGGVTRAGFHKLCFNTPYLDHLCELIAETVQAYPACDGIFLDIIAQGPCCCRWCLDGMAARGLDAAQPGDRQAFAGETLQRYFERTTAAVRDRVPAMPVFHNSGHISKGERWRLPYVSHLELESLPTGGWGYDHFPLSARYCSGLGLDYLGMTGKFHNTWGEFGGYKHPNALRYECAAMLAFGAKCSVGDQLHPDGRLDAGTYGIIGSAYAEVEAREPWCREADSAARVALLSCEASRTSGARDDAGDVGASRILLEGHIPFDVLDGETPFIAYEVLILPDDVAVSAAVRAKLDDFLRGGGRLVLSGASGLDADGQPLFDIGGTLEGLSPFQPDYVVPAAGLEPSFTRGPLVMALPSRQLRVTDGESLGDVYAPYFNRTFRHFCSHQHAPPRPTASGYACGSRKGNVLYLAHPVFSIYRASGAVALKHFVLNALRPFIGAAAGVRADLPSTARIALSRQSSPPRLVLHLLYAPTVSRGGEVRLSEHGYMRDAHPVEVIEDLPPLVDTSVAVRADTPVRRVSLEPEGRDLPFEQGQGWVRFTVERIVCHQIVVLHG